MSLLPCPIPHPLAWWDSAPDFVLEALEWVVGVEWPEGNEKLVWDHVVTLPSGEIKVSDPLLPRVLEPLKAYLQTLPGYKIEAKGKQEQKTLEQHGFISMQLTRLFGDMSFTYGHIFSTALGEVDIHPADRVVRGGAAVLPAADLVVGRP